MFTDDTQKMIDEQMSFLPKVSREAITASGWETTLRTIGYRNGLMLDEIEKLYAETLLVMIGAGYPEMFASNVAHHVDINDELAKKLEYEIIEEIFKPLHEDIIKRSAPETTEHEELFQNKSEETKHALSHDAVLNEIENPTKSTPSVSKLKLSDMFMKKPGASEHSPEKESVLREQIKKQPALYTKDSDPYLEPIE
jgi:hypothetical protein